MASQTGERKKLPSVDRDAVRDLFKRRGRKEVTKAMQHLSFKLSGRAEGTASRKTAGSPSPGRGFR